jgi:hypothetical protein
MTTYEGGCHCGAVRFRVRLQERIAIDCNCSICKKKGFLHLIVTREDFELVRGANALAEYRFNTGLARHRFCRHCGIHPFYTPRSHPDGVDVNARCLDDAPQLEIKSFDGEHWEQARASLDS